MAEIDGKQYFTELHWNHNGRAILPEKRPDGIYREWYCGRHKKGAMFYCKEQTRPYNQSEREKLREERRKIQEKRKAEYIQDEYRHLNSLLEYADRVLNMTDIRTRRDLNIFYALKHSLELGIWTTQRLTEEYSIDVSEYRKRLDQLNDIYDKKAYDFELYTAWRWLAQYHCIPREDAVVFCIDNSWWNDVFKVERPGESRWYYIRNHVVRVDDDTYERLKQLYIDKYGSWEVDNTEDTGIKWW